MAPFPAPSLTTRADHAHDTDLHVEELALRLADTDDPERCRELRDAIVELTLPLADAIAMRYTGRGIETDDLVQVARTALVKAAVRYRPGAGPGFAAFAAPTVSGEIKRWFRDQGWSVRPPRRIQELRSRLVVEEERLRHSVAAHTDRQRLVLQLRFVDELTQSEIGEHLGVSQMQVSRILSTVLERLRLDLLDAKGTGRGSAA